MVAAEGDPPMTLYKSSYSLQLASELYPSCDGHLWGYIHLRCLLPPAPTEASPGPRRVEVVGNRLHHSSLLSVVLSWGHNPHERIEEVCNGSNLLWTAPTDWETPLPCPPVTATGTLAFLHSNTRLPDHSASSSIPGKNTDAEQQIRAGLSWGVSFSPDCWKSSNWGIGLKKLAIVDPVSSRLLSYVN